MWGITCGIRQPTGRKFHPTQPPVGPVGSWDGLDRAAESDLLQGRRV